MSTRSVEAPVDALTPWERFYGLGARPFSLTPDLRFAFHSRSHSHALQQLTDALRRREGMIVITGEIGTGKTMLCRTLLQTFETRTFVSVILDAGLGVDDLLQQILADFGLVARPAPGVVSPPVATRHQMVTMLQRFLSTLIPLNAHAVVIADEAQQVDPAVLEQLRLLTNFETDTAKLLQVVLVGQPDLDEVLAQPEMRQLAQRVARRIELYPLSELEVQRYVERRLLVASEVGAAPVAGTGFESTASGPQFTPGAFRALATLTAGIPRVINTLCDRTLEIGFERQTFSIDEHIVNAAASRLKLSDQLKMAAPVDQFSPEEEQDSQPGPARPVRPLAWRWAAAVAVLLAGAGAWWMAARVRSPHPASGSVAPQVTQQPTNRPSAQPAAPIERPSDAGSSSSPAVALPAPTPPAPSGAAPASRPASAPGYYIAVAAFRTPQRASEVAEALTAAGLQAVVRQAPAGSWRQVVVGPFPSTQDAASAQPTLSRLGFQSTRILNETQPAR